MHLLAAQPGEIVDGSEAIDLGQSPGEIVVLSAAASDLSVLAQAHRRLDKKPTLRLANLLELRHNLSVDTYLDATLAHAKLIVVRLLGGVGYWPYGLDQITELARNPDFAVAFLPGDDQPDVELTDRSTVSPENCHRLWQYLVQGGMDNGEQFLRFAAGLIGYETEWLEPTPLIRSGLYWPGMPNPGIDEIQAHWQKDAPKAAIVFYRALVQAGNLKPVDALITSLDENGVSALPIFVSSLKDLVSAEMVSHLLGQTAVDVILNCTSFAVSSPGRDRSETPFDASDCPVFQVIFSGESREGWRGATRCLTPTDLGMNIALPEIDGRIITRAVSFKAPATYDEATESNIVEYQPEADRIEFVAKLAAAWARLRNAAPAARRVGIIVANYPNKDGRLCNGVGLDTPASVARALAALRTEGYDVGTDVPADSGALMKLLLRGPTNSGQKTSEKREGGVSFGMEEYQAFFAALPVEVRQEITERWGAPEDDPFFDGGAFTLAIHRFGNAVVAVQPARGYNIDPTATYHDPDLVPPHGYVAVYAWLRTAFDAHVVIHFGKHGNLEWLPGKALALSASCYPEAMLGPLPHLYPFIVNDPDEGTQAKRRSQAVIIDHLTPPL
ncbi:MAG: cobaltochelatase subunit CobN, partial [Proteobacteria bacterium]|nr:cobaltochelatase subunit CobN [Pseudomonadota bacterium]